MTKKEILAKIETSYQTFLKTRQEKLKRYLIIEREYKKIHDKEKFDKDVLELKKWYHKTHGFTEEEIESIDYDKVSLELDLRVPNKIGSFIMSTD